MNVKRSSRLVIVQAVCLLVMLAFYTPKVTALQIWERDLNAIVTAYNNGLASPEDLPRPMMERLTRNSNGIIIADGWVLVAAHTVASPNSNAVPGTVDYTGLFSSRTLNENGTWNQVPNAEGILVGDLVMTEAVFKHRVVGQEHIPNNNISDVALIKVEERNQPGLLANFDDSAITPLVTPSDLYAGIPVSFAGGAQLDYFENDDLSLSTPIVEQYLSDNSKSKYLWGRNRLEDAGLNDVTLNNTDLVGGGEEGQNAIIGGIIRMTMDPILDESSLKYEARGREGDSGGGAFIRDGWQWKAVGTNATGNGFSNVANSTISQWIEQTLTINGLGLPSQANAPVPIADTTWESTSHSLEWTTNAMQWSAGVPTASDDVWVKSSVVINSAAEAKDLFLGVDSGVSAATIGTTGSITLSASLFVAAEASDAATLTSIGGNIDAVDIYVGHGGTGSIFQINGETKAHESLRVGVEAGSNGTYILLSDAVANARNIIVGQKSGSVGVLDITSGGTQTLDSIETIVGLAGEGTITQAGGTHTTERLIIGRDSGSMGTYELSSGDLDTSKSISVNHGDFVQSGGTVTTQNLNVGAEGVYQLSSTGTVTTDKFFVEQGGQYQISGGNFNYTDINVQGKLVVTGGTISTNNSGVIAIQELDFVGSSASFSAEGIADLKDTTLSNSVNATINVVGDSLLVISPTIETSGIAFSFEGTPITVSDERIHVAGNTLQIDSNTVRGAGVIDDFVSIGSNGRLEALSNVQGNISLTKGLSKLPSGTVNLKDGLLTVPGGTTSDINAAISVPLLDETGVFEGKIEVLTDGKLILAGTPMLNGKLKNSGVFVVGDGVEQLVLQTGNSVRIADFSEYVTYEQSHIDSELVINIGATQSDKLSAKGLIINEGKLVLQLDSNDIPLHPTEPNILLPSNFVMNTPIMIAEASGSLYESHGKFMGVEYIDENGGDLTVARLSASLLGLEVVYDGEQELGGVTFYDSISVVPRILGDFDGNGAVTGADFSVFAANLNASPPLEGWTWFDGDYDGDGVVTAADFSYFASAFDAFPPPSSSSSSAAVPEAGSGLLLLMAISFGPLLRRRRN